MLKLSLDEILSLEDHDGLLDVKFPTSHLNSDESRIIQDFEELNLFIDKHGYLPGEGKIQSKPSLKEKLLTMRLSSYRANPRIAESLREHDRHSLLKDKTDVFDLDDILDSEDELLSTFGEHIFTMKHARPKTARPDKVSERKPAKNFQDFKPLFDACLADLVAGRRRSVRFANEQEINAGDFFILNGIMVYVAEVNDPHIRNGKRNARLKLVFENGTEGENLLRSLATELYKDPSGRRITTSGTGPLFGDAPKTELVLTPKDKITGSIYVVRSLSKDPHIASFYPDLFKIGFTTGSFEDRIRKAENDPTFLFAPVHPVRTYEAINMNTSKFETLIHRFLGNAQLNIEIMDRFGKPFKPQEWFVVPLHIIEQAIPMILDGTILRYSYDKDKNLITPTKN